MYCILFVLRVAFPSRIGQTLDGFPIDNGPAGGRRTGTATVYVEVLDVNDNRPIFLQNSYETSVLENIPRGTSILQVYMLIFTI